MTKLVYLIGEPGAGKTTLLRAALPEVASWPVDRHPFAHSSGTVQGVQLTYLGDPAGIFAGTDRLSMSVAPTAVEWLRRHDGDVVVGEGDRLATLPFFAAAKECRIVHVVSSDARRRRAERAVVVSKAQNERWIAGRVTKHRNLADLTAAEVLTTDGDLHEAAGWLRAVILGT